MTESKAGRGASATTAAAERLDVVRPVARMVAADAMAGSAALNAAAAALAGGVVLTATFPIDLVKTHMQTGGLSLGVTLRGLAVSPRSFYRGLSPAVLEHSLNRAMLFGVGALVKKQLPAHWPEPARDAVGGAGAASIKTLLLHPLDTVKCRWQLGSPRWEARGLYNGLGPAITRSSAGMAIWLSSRNWLERSMPEGGLLAGHLLSGGLASIIVDVCTFPFDTLKKNMQAASTAHGGALGAATQLLRSGGYARFYRGYGMRLLMVGTNGAMFNAALVLCKRLLAPLDADGLLV